MSNRTQTAIIIGGGIAGPVTAIALRQAGIEAVVYEAYPQSSNGLGGGMSMAPNGLDALDVIGVGDMVRPGWRGHVRHRHAGLEGAAAR